MQLQLYIERRNAMQRPNCVSERAESIMTWIMYGLKLGRRNDDE